MRLPIIRMDFNSSSLANRWTLEDIERQGIVFRAGMDCVFYDFDTQDDVEGLLHCESTLWWDAQSDRFRSDWFRREMRFTPSRNVSVLERLYAQDSDSDTVACASG